MYFVQDDIGDERDGDHDDEANEDAKDAATESALSGCFAHVDAPSLRELAGSYHKTLRSERSE